MAIIIANPGSLSTNLPIAPQAQMKFNQERAVYERYLNDIRIAVWDSLDKNDLPDANIDNSFRLEAAEEMIIKRSGRTSLTRAEFLALPASDQNKLIRGVILQTALYILPDLPQIKREDFGQYQEEYYQLSIEDKIKGLTDRISILFPEDPTNGTTPGNLTPSGGSVVCFDRAF